MNIDVQENFVAPRSLKELLRSGDLNAAEAIFRQQIEIDPNDADGLLGLSAIMRKRRSRKDARELLTKAAQARPIERSVEADPKQLILRPRCLDSANYCAVGRPTGAIEFKFKGGHFALAHLLHGEKRNLVTANLVAGDPSPLHAAGKARLLLNTIACADRGRRSLKAVAQYLREHPHLPAINRPQAVLRTTRDGNYQRLAGIRHTKFPKTLRVSLREGRAALLATLAREEMTLPLILRATGRQTGREVYLCSKLADIDCALHALRRKRHVYAIAFTDCRRNGEMFHKARAFFIDGEVYPVAWLANDMWQIHSGDRYRVMASSEHFQAMERHYLADPEAACGKAAWQAIHDVGQALQLDFAGIDFTVSAAGELFIFETNAAMRHNFDHVAAFPYTRPHLETVSRAFAKMMENRIGSPRWDRQFSCEARATVTM